MIVVYFHNSGTRSLSPIVTNVRDDSFDTGLYLMFTIQLRKWEVLRKYSMHKEKKNCLGFIEAVHQW